jgi:hypothetical protein
LSGGRNDSINAELFCGLCGHGLRGPPRGWGSPRFLDDVRLPTPTIAVLAPAVIPIGSRGEQRDAIVVTVRLGEIAEAVGQGVKAK